jgi:hypothetical protein
MQTWAAAPLYVVTLAHESPPAHEVLPVQGWAQ